MGIPFFCQGCTSRSNWQKIKTARECMVTKGTELLTIPYLGLLSFRMQKQEHKICAVVIYNNFAAVLLKSTDKHDHFVLLYSSLQFLFLFLFANTVPVFHSGSTINSTNSDFILKIQFQVTKNIFTKSPASPCQRQQKNSCFCSLV